MEPLLKTPQTTFHRRASRGSYDRALAHAILDEAIVCHVGFVAQDVPAVIPTAFVRVGDEIFVHGAVANGMLAALAAGAPVCVTVTLLDGLVMARSAFHHSMNYRSVVAFGKARIVTDLAEKRAVLHALVEKVEAGRSAVTRAPTDAELRATSLLAVPLQEASVKTRAGGPIDDEDDMKIDCRVGEIALVTRREWRETPGEPPAPQASSDGSPGAPSGLST